MGVGEPWEDPLAWGTAEEVQLPIHVQFVRVQLHLLLYGDRRRDGVEGEAEGGRPRAGQRVKKGSEMERERDSGGQWSVSENATFSNRGLRWRGLRPP